MPPLVWSFLGLLTGMPSSRVLNPRESNTGNRGAKAVELGKIAAGIARFVSKGHASNDLLDCLEHNSLFTRQMSDRFRHQLEDYRVVSFIEGKEVQLGGAGPASISHVGYMPVGNVMGQELLTRIAGC